MSDVYTKFSEVVANRIANKKDEAFEIAVGHFLNEAVNSGAQSADEVECVGAPVNKQYWDVLKKYKQEFEALTKLTFEIETVSGPQGDGEKLIFMTTKRKADKAKTPKAAK